MTGPNDSLFNKRVFTYLWDKPVARLSIRNQIVASFSKDLTEVEKQNILDLNQLPKSKSLFFSISHSPAGCGFVAYHKPIGFDIEQTWRTKKQSLINKISTPQEQSLFKDNWFLIWSIKESAFKRLSQQECDIQVMSKTNIENVYDQKENELKAIVTYKDHHVLCHSHWDKNKILSICT